MGKRIEDLHVIGNKQINEEFFVIKLTADNKLPDINPGQFAQALVEGSDENFLRIPVSIHDVDYDENTLKILLQVVGKGTKALSNLKEGDSLNLVYPLGKPFNLPEKGAKTLLVGGGCGIAPLLFLGKHLKANGFVPDILLGFRSNERIIEYDEYLKVGNVYLTTNDGSKGEKGLVSQHSILKNVKYDKIYCCGPESMMRAIAAYSKENSIECEVSLENLMACGIGVCLCCIVDTVNGNQCSCTDGPVFNISELKW